MSRWDMFSELDRSDTPESTTSAGLVWHILRGHIVVREDVDRMRIQQCRSRLFITPSGIERTMRWVTPQYCCDIPFQLHHLLLC